MPDNNNGLAPRRLFLSIIVAAVVAAVILFLFVLPAEYGKDITGLGQKIGINGMSVSANEKLSEKLELKTTSDERAVHNVFEGPLQFMETEIVLEAYGQAEYKFDMQASQKLSYQWRVEGGLAYADLHGHTPDPSGEGETLVRYLESDMVAGASGEFTTPFAGEHGWYFLNLETTEIKIHIRASGHWDARELIPLASQL